jgi:hypothetical protein
MTEDRTKADEKPAETPEQDTEGHGMWISPTLSRDLATSRSRDIEREARERQRAKESRSR